MTNLIASRAHRILRHLESYSDAANNTERTPLRLEQQELPADERLLGWYAHSLGDSQDGFAVTTKGLRISDGGGFRLIGYEQILSVAALGPKNSVDHLTVELKDRTVVELSVRGGRSRLRDAWEVLRFLKRVIEDSRKMASKTA